MAMENHPQLELQALEEEEAMAMMEALAIQALTGGLEGFK